MAGSGAQSTFPAAVAAALVSGETDATEREVADVSDSVARSIEGMPDFLRLGVGAVSLVASQALRMLGPGDFGAAPLARRAELAARLEGMPLPGMSEFVRLTRGLGLVSLYESREGVTGAEAAAGAR